MIKSSYKRTLFEKKAWKAQNQEIFESWLEETKAVQKAFKEQYPTAEERKAQKKLGFPKLPELPDPILQDDIAALSVHLTQKLEEAKIWLWQQLDYIQYSQKTIRKSSKKNSKQLAWDKPKVYPKNMASFYLSLPLSIRKTLQDKAKEKEILLYLLCAQRTVFDQTIQDLQKTQVKAFSNLKKGISAKKAGFPRFKKFNPSGSFRMQMPGIKNKRFYESWQNQQFFLPGLDQIIHWKDRGYKLPSECAKMVTIQKTKTQKYYLTFVGEACFKKEKPQKISSQSNKGQVFNSREEAVESFLGNIQGFDVNRESGIPILVGSVAQTQFEQQQGQSSGKMTTNYTNDDFSNIKIKNKKISKKQPGNQIQDFVFSILDQQEIEKFKAKIKKKEDYIALMQSKLASQREHVKRNRKNKKNNNPNRNHLKHFKTNKSKRYLKNQSKLVQAYEGLNNLTEFYLKALARNIVAGKDVLCLEKLSVKAMKEKKKPKNKSRKHHQNDQHSQHRASFGKLLTYVEQACEKQGIDFLQADRYDPSSQICSSCGFRWGKLSTNIRSITCSGCKKFHLRDVNAAINIKFMALYRYLMRLRELQHEESGNSTHKPLDERNDGRPIEKLSQITHEELENYVRKHYPFADIFKTTKTSCEDPLEEAFRKFS